MIIDYDKKIFAKNLKYHMNRLGLSATDISTRLHVSNSSVSDWANAKKMPRMDKIETLASIFGVQKSDLIEERESKQKYLSPDITSDFETFPVIGDLAAGYDHLAVEDWSGETIDIPSRYLKGHAKEDYIVLSVKGDSMYPLYHEGDKVLILRQDTLPEAGAVCAVLYRDEFATLKKVECGEDFVRLVPLNMNYGPRTITGEDLHHFRIIGVPKLLIRELF